MGYEVSLWEQWNKPLQPHYFYLNVSGDLDIDETFLHRLYRLEQYRKKGMDETEDYFEGKKLNAGRSGMGFHNFNYFKDLDNVVISDPKNEVICTGSIDESEVELIETEEI